jgi:hypothetical protein
MNPRKFAPPVSLRSIALCALGLAAAGLFGGCVSRPLLYVDPFETVGRPRGENFRPGAVPTLYYSSNPGLDSETVIQVRRARDGEVVATARAHNPEIERPISFYDYPATISPPSLVSFPQLSDGKYLGELWVSGQLKVSCKFTVSGRGSSPGFDFPDWSS